eukprot:2392-Heterococcus_DN1.PRE.3
MQAHYSDAAVRKVVVLYMTLLSGAAGAKPSTVPSLVMQHSTGFLMPQQPAGITVIGHVALRSLPQ